MRWGYPESGIWNEVDNLKPLNTQDEEELLLSGR